MKKIFTLSAVIILILPLFSLATPISKAEITTIPTYLPEAILGTSAVWDGTNAYIFGGGDFIGPKNTILQFNPLTNSITVMGATLPYHVADPFAAFDGRYAYLFSGWSLEAWGNAGNIVRYDTQTDTVDIMGPTLSTWDMTVAWSGQYAYLFGGWNGYSYYDQILRYDPAADVLTTMSAHLPFGMKWSSAFYADGFIYLLGGSKDYNTPFNQIIRYDPASDSVTFMSVTLPQSVYFTSAVWTGTYAYLFGGNVDTIPTCTDAIVRYDPINDECITETDTLPSPRASTSAIWTGQCAYIFGGGTGSEILNEIVKFEPSQPTAGEVVSELVEIVQTMNLQQGISNSLDTKLQNVLDSLTALNADQRNDAINKLEAFINSVEAQRLTKLTNEQADELIAQAQSAISLIQA